MNTQELLKSPDMIGLILPRTKLEQVAARQILSLPKGILPQVKSRLTPAARTQQVARPVHWPICSQFDIWEQVVFALLGSAALLLILIAFL